MPPLFVDTSYFIALTNQKDEFHDLALEWARRIKTERITCHTTVPIIFEIGDGFSRFNRRNIGVDLIKNITQATNYVLHPFNPAIFEKTLKIYYKYSDKEWGLTDCYSFQVMTEQKMIDVLTADNHFVQYGFNILLKHATK